MFKPLFSIKCRTYRCKHLTEKSFIPITSPRFNVAFKVLNHLSRLDKRYCNEVNTLGNPKINVQPVLIRSSDLRLFVLFMHLKGTSNLIMSFKKIIEISFIYVKISINNKRKLDAQISKRTLVFEIFSKPSKLLTASVMPCRYYQNSILSK